MPRTSPPFIQLLERFQERHKNGSWLPKLVGGAPVDPKGRYLHWDDIRRRASSEEVAEAAFAVTKFARQKLAQRTHLRTKEGSAFWFCEPPAIRRALADIDRRASGVVGVKDSAITRETQTPYLQRSLIEEPFMSSVLEGAATTRAIAKQLIEDNRSPRSHDERMVLNNHRAMELIRRRQDEPLSPDMVMEIHRVIAEDAMDGPGEAGAFRQPGDNVNVVDSTDNEILHAPPPASELPERLQDLCDFANGLSDGDAFIHPIVRAIIVHFMLAYDHPFPDGNGRTARALFYWSVLRGGYWLLEYISISSIIKRAPTKYGRAFLLTEADEGDLTYFIDHQLGVICEAIDGLHDYIEKKQQEFQAFDQVLVRRGQGLNTRQRALLQEAIRRPRTRFMIAEHQARHRVSYLTARADLEDLARRRLLRKIKRGTTSVYLASSTIAQTLDPLAEAKKGRL
ncbi:MAG: Fic family protein [Alphaproteobacteria bacterium]|nr:Fic family protein [Alphaproteobacteria bacterium]